MGMNIKELLFFILNVLKDWRVIVITVAMILVISFTNYITSYHKKKKRKNKKKKSSEPQPAPAPAPAVSEEQAVEE